MGERRTIRTKAGQLISSGTHDHDTPSQPQSERSKRHRQWVGLRQTVGGVEFPWSYAKGRPFASY